MRFIGDGGSHGDVGEPIMYVCTLYSALEVHIYRVVQKTGPPAILSHCKYSENSMTELHGNWWTSAILYAEHSH